MWVIILIIFDLILFYFIWCFIRDRLHNKYKAGTILMLGEKTANEQLDEIELSDVSMRLKSGEACFLKENKTFAKNANIIHADYGITLLREGVQNGKKTNHK